jgi:hypothetical protein
VVQRRRRLARRDVLAGLDHRVRHDVHGMSQRRQPTNAIGLRRHSTNVQSIAFFGPAG